MDGAIYEALLDMLSQIKNTADRMTLIVKNKKGRGTKLGEAVNEATGLFRSLMPYFENDLQNGEPFNLLASELVEMISYCNGESYEEEVFAKRCAAFAEELKRLYHAIVPAWKELIYLEMQPKLLGAWLGSYRHNYFMRKMERAKENPELKTLVTGLSYALYGVDDSRMENASNLAFISQDFYYAYAINKALLPACPGIKYSIIGISYYTPFFDLSSSINEGKPSVEGLYWPALKDGHNCKDFNKKREFSYEQEFSHLISTSNGLLSQKELEAAFEKEWQQAFGNSFFNRFQNRYALYNENIFAWEEERLRRACAERGATHNNQLSYTETEIENRQLFVDYLTLCETHEVTPVFVVFPAFSYYREALDPRMKETLYRMLVELTQDHSFLLSVYWG